MRKDIAKLWSAAAKSREFKQGFGYLDKGHKLCVMGILCNLALVYGVCDTEEVDKNLYNFDKELGRVPVSVKNWAELRGQNGEMEGEFVTLAGLNDVFGYTLGELGSVIEENWEKL